MNTPVLNINSIVPEPGLIKQAADALVTGKILILPTDTVYGIAQLVSREASPVELKRIKQRPEEKSIPILIARPSGLQRYSSGLPVYAKELAVRHWPGALTLVVRASDEIPPAYVADDGSVALRMPAHNITLALLEACGTLLACTSANLSGEAPAVQLSELDPLLIQQADLVIDGGMLSGGVASTVVSCLGEEPLVLRPGPVTL